MGIHDREYYRDDEPRGIHLGGARTMVINIVLVTVVVWLVDQILMDRQLTELMKLRADWFQRPWTAWQLLTYGLLHDRAPLHILFNMLILWFFGRDVEAIYGKKEFLKLYLSLVILAGLVWSLTEYVTVAGPISPSAVGASGAVAGVVIIYICHYPHRTLLLWFVLPVRAWVLGVLWIVADIYGALQGEGRVAYTAHLGGMAFGFLFFRTKWHLGRLLPRGLSLSALRPRPRLRLHDPSDEERQLARAADAVLEKINRHGQDSLTRKERRILEQYSRRMKQKHR